MEFKLESRTRKLGAHVVLVPYPSQGHINPLLQFAKRLASKGLKATLATTRYTVASICAPGVSVEPISDGFDSGGYAQAGSEAQYIDSFRTNGSKTLSQLLQKYQNSDSPVRCIVYDSFLPWALDVAKQYGLYGAAFFTNSVAVCSIFCRIHRGELALPLDAEETPLVVPYLPPLNFRDLPSFLRFPDSYPAYLAMKLSQFPNVDDADWIFSNSFQGLEGSEAKGVRELWPAKLIGPMVPSAYLDDHIKGDRSYGSSLWKPLSEECLEWLETRPPRSVTYIAFGSMVTFTQEETEEIAWGLKESNMSFLWVVRESEAKNLPEWFKQWAEQKGKVVSWCNQLEVLAHSATGCFMTHCGWNSTLEGLSLGVPMVGVPKWADQLTDAKYLSEIWGVGVRAAEDEDGIVRRGEVVRCLKEVMEGERCVEIRRNAEKWREAAKKAISEGGSSDNCINEFVEHLVSTKEEGY